MKTILTLLILFCIIALPARGELTDADLDKIRLIVREEVKAEITASETRIKEYIDLKLDNVNTEFKRVDSKIKDAESQIGFMRTLFIGVVGLPLVIITALFAWRAFRDRATEKQIQVLIAENEYLKQQTITP